MTPSPSLAGSVAREPGRTSSPDNVEGQGQRDDQRADAEVDRFVAEEDGGEFPEHRARPVIACGPGPRDLAVDPEAAGDDGGPEHMIVTGHDDAPVAGPGPVHDRLAEREVLLGRAGLILPH